MRKRGQMMQTVIWTRKWRRARRGDNWDKRWIEMGAMKMMRRRDNRWGSRWRRWGQWPNRTWAVARTEKAEEESVTLETRQMEAARERLKASEPLTLKREIYYICSRGNGYEGEIYYICNRGIDSEEGDILYRGIDSEGEIYYICSRERDMGASIP
jgi:hypothetical protein